MRFGVVADIIGADTPLMCGQGVYSVCRGDFSRIFHGLKSFAASHDFMIGNFEAVLVDRIDKVTPAKAAMKSPRSIIPALQRCKFRYMGIANNHTMEYGPESCRWM